VTEIFVFGSNFAGRHGKGAALHAHKHQLNMAKPLGVWGPHMQSRRRMRTCSRCPSIDRIRGYVEAFLVYAAQSPDLKFRVIAIGNWARRLWPRGDRTYVRQRAK
jgi:hypothetical protein